MSENLGDLELLNEFDEPVIMKSLWESQPAVLVFVRHFG